MAGIYFSPLLSNSREIFKEELHDVVMRNSINGKILNNVSYGDDTIILARTSDNLQILINGV